MELAKLADTVVNLFNKEKAITVSRPELDPQLAADRYLGDARAIRTLEAELGLAPIELSRQVESTADYLFSPYYEKECL